MKQLLRKKIKKNYFGRKKLNSLIPKIFRLKMYIYVKILLNLMMMKYQKLNQKKMN